MSIYQDFTLYSLIMLSLLPHKQKYIQFIYRRKTIARIIDYIVHNLYTSWEIVLNNSWDWVASCKKKQQEFSFILTSSWKQLLPSVLFRITESIVTRKQNASVNEANWNWICFRFDHLLAVTDVKQDIVCLKQKNYFMRKQYFVKIGISNCYIIQIAKEFIYAIRRLELTTSERSLYESNRMMKVFH